MFDQLDLCRLQAINLVLLKSLIINLKMELNLGVKSM